MGGGEFILLWYWAWGMESVVYFCFFFFLSFHISTGMLNTMGRGGGVIDHEGVE